MHTHTKKKMKRRREVELFCIGDLFSLFQISINCLIGREMKNGLFEFINKYPAGLAIMAPTESPQLESGTGVRFTAGILDLLLLGCFIFSLLLHLPLLAMGESQHNTWRELEKEGYSTGYRSEETGGCEELILTVSQALRLNEFSRKTTVPMYSFSS